MYVKLFIPGMFRSKEGLTKYVRVSPSRGNISINSERYICIYIYYVYFIAGRKRQSFGCS